MPRLFRALAFSLVPMSALVMPSIAFAAMPPLTDAAGLVTSDHSAQPHVAVVWPTSAGQKNVHVTPTANGNSSTWKISLAGGDTTLPATVSGVCSTTAPTEITCTVTLAQMNAGIEVWTGDDADTVQFDDNITPDPSDGIAPVYAFLRDGGAVNGQYQFFNGGPANDFVDTATGNNATYVATNWLTAKGGTDTYVTSTTDIDIVSFADHTSGQPVNVTMDGIANDGYPTLDGFENVPTRAQGVNAVFGGAGDDTIVGDDGSTFFDGLGGNDTIDGRGATDQLFGGNGSDKLTGGAGHDEFHGDMTWEERGSATYSPAGDGDDQFFLRDGEGDDLKSCGAGADEATMDLVAVDADFPPGSDECETKHRASVDTTQPAPPTTPTPGTPSDTDGDGRADTADNCPAVRNADQHDGDKDGAGDVCDPADVERTFVMPNLTPVRTKRKFSFTSLEKVRTLMDASGANLKVKVVRQPLKLVTTPSWRPSIDDGDVFRQTPKPGAKLQSDATPPFPTVTLYVYDESMDYSRKTCPYGDKKALNSLMRGVEGEELGRAQDILRSKGCEVRITKEFVSRTAPFSRVFAADKYDRKTKSGRELAIALVVERPRRKDFAINLTERPKTDWTDPANREDRAQFKKEIGPGTDGKLTAGLAPAVVHLEVVELRTGRLVRNLEVEISTGSNGKILASTRTDIAGGLTFTVPVDFTGELDVTVRFEGTNTTGFETLESWQTIQVVDRGGKPFFEPNGRYFTWSAKQARYVQSTPPPTPSEIMATVEARMEDMVCAALGTAPVLVQACDALRSQAGTPQERIAKVADLGVMVGKMGAGTTFDANFREGVTRTLPSLSISPTGATTKGFAPGVQIPTVGNIATVSIVSRDGAGIVSRDGAGILVNNGGNLIGNNGNTLIGNNGNTLIGNNGNTLVGPDGASLVNAAKASLVKLDLATLVGPDGASLVGPDGASLVGPDGASLIGPDGATFGTNGSNVLSHNGGAFAHVR